MEKSTKEAFFDLLTKQGVYGKIKGIAKMDSYTAIKECVNTLDLYCSKCVDNKTFIYKDRESNGSMGHFYQYGEYVDAIQQLSYRCPTCNQVIVFCLLIKENELVKIGQYPSLFDITRDELKQYQKNSLIDKDSFAQIYKAEICASESYFVAAYTYMRRVYECLLLSVFNQHREELGISDEEFRKLRSDEKISKIKPYLAIEEAIYKPLYALLSAGIHSLSEEECGEDYTLLKTILLDILAAQKVRQQKEESQKRVLELYAAKKSELK